MSPFAPQLPPAEFDDGQDQNHYSNNHLKDQNSESYRITRYPRNVESVHEGYHENVRQGLCVLEHLDHSIEAGTVVRPRDEQHCAKQH